LEFTTYALASLLITSWTEARVTKVNQGFRKVLEVLGEAPVAPEQEKVRSITQRRGRTTKPFMSSLRLMIAKRSRGTFGTAASTCQALEPPSAQISSSYGKRRHTLSSTKPAPSGSWIAAEWTTTRIGSPSLSTRAWICALDLLAGVATDLPVITAPFSADFD
jgi:hypothetical protein